MVVCAVERVSRFLLKLDEETNWRLLLLLVSLDELLYSRASLEDAPCRGPGDVSYLTVGL